MTQRCHLQRPSIVPKDFTKQLYIIFKEPTLSFFRNKTSTVPKPHFRNPMTQTHKTNWGVEPQLTIAWPPTLPWCLAMVVPA
jgi:hypothetical protein